MGKNWSYYVLLIYTFSVYGPMAAMSIGAGVILAQFIYSYFSKHKLAHFKIAPVQYRNATFGLSIACIWSLVWAKTTALSFYGMVPRIDILRDSYKLWHIWFPFLLVSLLGAQSDKKQQKIIQVWLYCGLALAVFEMIQYHLPIYWPQRLPHLDYDTYVKPTGIKALFLGSYHATGLAGFHLSFASIFIFPTAVWFAWFAIKLRKEGWNQKTVFLALGCVLFFITNILTYSKTTWLVMPILVVSIAVVVLSQRLKVALVAAMIIFAVAGVQSSEFKLRFQGTDTIKERFEVWKANLEMVRQNPLFGVGWHQNSSLSEAYYMHNKMHGFISHAHNNFLDQLASTGILGLGFYLFWNFLIIWFALDVYRKSKTDLTRAFGLGCVFAWGSFHFFGLTQTNFWDAKVMHQMGWVIAMTFILHAGIKSSTR